MQTKTALISAGLLIMLIIGIYIMSVAATQKSSGLFKGMADRLLLFCP